MMEKNFVFTLELKVRDYECDMQGIVNNSVYQNYLEHVRHEYLLSVGIDFAVLCEEGINAVVARINMAFKNSLASGDIAVCRLAIRQEGIKFIFDQNIYRKSDDKLCLTAAVTTVLVQNGRMVVPEHLAKALLSEV